MRSAVIPAGKYLSKLAKQCAILETKDRWIDEWGKQRVCVKTSKSETTYPVIIGVSAFLKKNWLFNY